ncbi:MAG: rhomboid family intramembrane serine protease [Acidobacteriota bacterium]
MSHRFNRQGFQVGQRRILIGGGPLTPAIKGIIVTCVTVFLIQTILTATLGQDPLSTLFGLSSKTVLTSFWVWQPVTYLFLHGGLLHIVFNMLFLWMFGTELERRWGAQAFVQFYLFCGIGAGLTSILLDPVAHLFGFGEAWVSARATVGASGAIYGVMAAQAILFPDKLLLLFLVIPMRMRQAVLLLAGIMLFTQLTTPGSGVNNVAHLGGMVFAWLYLRRVWNLRRLWADWRWRVRRKKYRVVADIRDDDRFHYH